MSTQVISEYQTAIFESSTCSCCGVKYFMPQHLKAQRLEDGKSFWCPNGHEQCFIESAAAKLEKAKAELARLNSRLSCEIDQHAAAKESILRLKKRVAGGVCPCCRRTFRQLARHMETEHPHYPQTT